MTRHIEGITAAQLDEQLDPTATPKELSNLAAAFNAMLQRLGKSFTQLSQFSADLAHELRTPINNLMDETEVALSRLRSADEYHEVLESNLEEYGRLSRTIESLLFLARAENTGIALTTVRLDGRAEVEAACSYHQALADEKGIRLRCEGQGYLYADAQLFKRVLSNVLLNALQYTLPGGEIRLALHPANDGTTEIVVQDTGCGSEFLPFMDEGGFVLDYRAPWGTSLAETDRQVLLSLVATPTVYFVMRSRVEQADR